MIDELRVPPGRRGLVWTLGFGAFGLAFALTMTAAYLPPVLGRFTGERTIIGAILGAEGFFALALPLVVGPWSDAAWTRLGRRRPFMTAAVPPMAACLALIGFMPSLWTTTLVVLALFFFYYVYEPPYRSLYPDLLPASVYGRAQSVQHLLRGIAIGGALIGGGFLLHLWRPAPFLAGSFVTAGACGITIAFIHERRGDAERVFRGFGHAVAVSWAIVRGDRDVRRFLYANACWEGTFAAMRTFVVLYVTRGMHQPIAVSSAVLGTVTAGYVVAALAAGPLGDRLGLARVILWAATVYGLGLLVGGFPSHWHSWYYALIFPVAVAAGIVMTLAWGLLFKLMPPGERGAIAGLATMTKGLGLILGPLVAGAAIDAASPYLETTRGYQVLWPIAALPILVSIPVVWSLRRAET